jgi:hypothetical protein
VPEGLGEHLLRLAESSLGAFLFADVPGHPDDALHRTVLVTNRYQRGLKGHVWLRGQRRLLVPLRLARLEAAAADDRHALRFGRWRELTQPQTLRRFASHPHPFRGLAIEGLEHEVGPGHDLDQENAVAQVLEDRLQLLQRIAVARVDSLPSRRET